MRDELDEIIRSSASLLPMRLNVMFYQVLLLLVDVDSVTDKSQFFLLYSTNLISEQILSPIFSENYFDSEQTSFQCHLNIGLV